MALYKDIKKEFINFFIKLLTSFLYSTILPYLLSWMTQKNLNKRL